MYQHIHLLFGFMVSLVVATSVTSAEDVPAGQESKRRTELNAFWHEVSRSVREGDFDGYAATCHPLGVLVSESKQTSYSLKQALAGWKQGFVDTKAGKIQADVEFRFSHRLGNADTAHETGIFGYSVTDEAGPKKVSLIHFTALLVKSNGRWQVMMEHQKKRATQEQWETLLRDKRNGDVKARFQ